MPYPVPTLYIESTPATRTLAQQIRSRNLAVNIQYSSHDQKGQGLLLANGQMIPLAEIRSADHLRSMLEPRRTRRTNCPG